MRLLPRRYVARALVGRSEAEAEAARRRADACVSKANAEATAMVKRANTEVEVAHMRADTEVQVKLAEAEATRAELDAAHKRADAEVQFKRAEAEAARKRADADAEAKNDAKHWWLALVASRSVGVLLFALDWFWHENEAWIKLRMEKQLGACNVPATAERAPRVLDVLPLPRPQPLVLGFIPSMVLGPTGCGKSTLLAKVAHDTATGADNAPAPTVLVRMRLPLSSDEGPKSGDAEGEQRRACVRLQAAAAQMYAQIGFPARRALLIEFLKWLQGGVLTLLHDQTYATKVEQGHVSERFACSLRALFEVSETMFRARLAKGMDVRCAAPALLFDDVQDLIRDEQLARAGGKYIFDELATLLVAYAVDRQVVRAAVAGSSALLSIEFDKTVATGARWTYYELPDPDEGAVLAALRKRGYSDTDARGMVALCGTRLRLLHKPLVDGPSLTSADEFIASMKRIAEGNLQNLFGTASTADKALLASALDAALAAEVDAAAPVMSVEEARFSSRLAQAASTVLYVQLNHKLVFQSRLHAGAWRRMRAEIKRAAGVHSRWWWPTVK